MSAYKDLSGLFTSKGEDVLNLTGGSSIYGGALGYMKAEPHMKIEDEEDLLYGETGSTFKMNSVSILMHTLVLSGAYQTKFFSNLNHKIKVIFRTT